LNTPQSSTGKYLGQNNQSIQVKKRKFQQPIVIKGANANNLKNIDINIPTKGIISITGVSGSGKTSLAFDVIADSFNAGRAVNCTKAAFHNIDFIIVIDQQKIGTSSLSTPSTYTGMFDLIREIFAKLHESKSRKLTKSSFSFNSKDGRCPTCKGMGNVKVSMDFLSDVWVVCDTCNGKRYKNTILDIKFNGLTINDILNLEVSDAISIFKDHSKISNILTLLHKIGLGYVKLGQATSTLSGGETQRLKLANELINATSNNGLFVFDEPSTGLHMQDVENLISVFNNLVDKGNTVLVVEHNLNIIRASDWIIDLGPEGGDLGGEVLFAGTPINIVDCETSFTGKALKNIFFS
jgi:excinuclease ABC subunit A